MIPPRVATPVQMGTFRDIVILSDPAPWNSVSVIPPRVATPVQMGTFRDIVRLSDPAMWNSDSMIPPLGILIQSCPEKLEEIETSDWFIAQNAGFSLVERSL